MTRGFEARQAHELRISAMSWAELHRGVTRLPESRRRHELAAWLQDLEAGFEGRILSFDRKAAEVWAQMTVQAEPRGKPLAAFDSIIVAAVCGATNRYHCNH